MAETDPFFDELKIKLQKIKGRTEEFTLTITFCRYFALDLQKAYLLKKNYSLKNNTLL